MRCEKYDRCDAMNSTSVDESHPTGKNSPKAEKPALHYLLKLPCPPASVWTSPLAYSPISKADTSKNAPQLWKLPCPRVGV